MKCKGKQQQQLQLPTSTYSLTEEEYDEDSYSHNILYLYFMNCLEIVICDSTFIGYENQEFFLLEWNVCG
ncbi:hypothetical protein DERF_000168 [Dermatophagoides farinae]|uniref:Uncharacterized protein n=1 Tax=Dermatophagoides farinae TaxID=6954 RepID=A0A922IAZ0_DERFA|nr:hypothetical protein DERF_000168 [Dermatophagoides farinae]